MASKQNEQVEAEVIGTEVATVDHGAMVALADQVESLRTGGRGIFSSLPNGTFEEKLATADALANALPMADHLGTPINLVHFVAQAIEVTNVDLATRESRKVPATRIVLVDADGTAYAGVSDGIFKSLQNLVSIFGAPATWERPIPVQVQRVKGNNGYSYHTLKIG